MIKSPQFGHEGQDSVLGRQKKPRGQPNLHIINIREIRNPNNKTIENPNICYLSQQLDSTKLTDIIIMSINSKVLHITSFEYLFNLISLLNIVSLNHSLRTSGSTSVYSHKKFDFILAMEDETFGQHVHWIEDHEGCRT